MVVLVFITIDRAPHGNWGMLLTLSLLAAALFSDGLALIIAVGPLIVVSAIRLLKRSSEAPQDVRLLVGAVAAVPLNALMVLAVRRVQGFHIYPLAPAPAAPRDIPSYAAMALNGLADFFGVDPTGVTGGVGVASLVLHLIGLIVVAFAVGAVVRRWSASTDR